MLKIYWSFNEIKSLIGRTLFILRYTFQHMENLKNMIEAIQCNQRKNLPTILETRIYNLNISVPDAFDLFQ